MKPLEIKQRQRQLRRDNRAFGTTLVNIPPKAWPKGGDPTRIAVWRSLQFMVQVFAEPNGIKRLTVNRTELRKDGHWKAGITWDDLQRLKEECGYGSVDAVEVYPADPDIVNVANMRHLWVLPEPLAFKWTNTEARDI